MGAEAIAIAGLALTAVGMGSSAIKALWKIATEVTKDRAEISKQLAVSNEILASMRGMLQDHEERLRKIESA